MRIKHAALLPFLLVSAVAYPQVETVCPPEDKECVAKAIREHVVTRREFWDKSFAKPVAERVSPAPPELIDYITLENIRDEVPNRPHPPTYTPGFMEDLRTAFKELPPRVRRLLSEKLVGINLLEDLGGTGYTDYVFDKSSQPVAGFTAFDTAVLESKSANEWATWKDSSPFQAQPGWRLEAVIEDGAADTRKNAIQYIMLHEFGHVLSIGGRFHPRWDIEQKDAGKAADYPFFALSWTLSKDAKRYETIFDSKFPERKDAVFYFGAKYTGDQMANIYDKLEQTNFATLYSVNHPGDDFAEAFANYVHVVMMKKPFTITIYHDGKVVKVYQSCWSESRCADKREILEQFLGVN